jgi:hypothetical protein
VDEQSEAQTEEGMGLLCTAALHQLLPGVSQVLTSGLSAAVDSVEVGRSVSGPQAFTKLIEERYSAAEGRKQRKDLLSQLKALIPIAQVDALADALLESGALHPPLAKHTATLASSQASIGKGKGLDGGPLQPGAALPAAASPHLASTPFVIPLQGSGGEDTDALAVLEGSASLPRVRQMGSSTTSAESAAASLGVSQAAWNTCELIIVSV